MAFERRQVTIVATWNSIGMRGTGSHDIEVREVFVPLERSFSVFTDPREPGVLYRIPFDVLTELPITAVAVGVARHALEAFAALARVKKAAHSEHMLGQDPLVQSEFAKSHACLCAWRAGVWTIASQVWEAALAQQPLGPERFAEITAMCAQAASELRSAIGQLAQLSGMTAIAQDEELSRAWRDLQTVAAHSSISPRQLVAAGSALLDIFSSR